MIYDVTKQKEAEAALRESEEKYRQFFMSESDAIIVFDKETFEFLDVNPAAMALYGYSKEEFLSLKQAEILEETYQS